MVSHVSLGVRDLRRAVAFYDAVMATLGVARVWSTDEAVGYGPPGGDDELALFLRPSGAGLGAGSGFHLALRAADAAAVDAFWTAALAHGGADEGPPGLRPHYGAEYYAAFVTDPDGHKLEAKRD
ncbi:MAG: VOC family protein [Deltaproteobacteria bacterium]|nr:VOC family protein [Deltaproteobacteria bacterium]